MRTKVRHQARFHRTGRVLASGLAALWVLTAGGQARGGSSPALTINEAFVDAAGSELDIVGENFGAKPGVTFAGKPLVVKSASATNIVAALRVPPPGSYRLVVSRGQGEKDSAAQGERDSAAFEVAVFPSSTGMCSAGFADCDHDGINGCETNVTSNPNNCGACGTTCSNSHGTTMCSNGSCVVGTCSAGFANCDGNGANGCETNVTNDPNNCGACGTKCMLGLSCVSGMCTPMTTLSAPRSAAHRRRTCV